MLARSTQTNEPGRCAALLPVLAGLPEPLALLEVGASAGLCLFPDFYAYDYGGPLLGPAAGRNAPPVFPCAVNAATPLPARLPRIVWRAGLDLNPVDLADPGEVAWLEALIWPEETDRLARLRAAIAIAAVQKPRLVKGDLGTDLAALAREAPKGATLVIFHTAVLAYISSAAEREEFARSVGSLCDFWIANEAPQVFPGIAGRAGRGGAERQLPVVRERLSGGLDRSAWRIGRLDHRAAEPVTARRKGPFSFASGTDRSHNGAAAQTQTEEQRWTAARSATSSASASASR